MASITQVSQLDLSKTYTYADYLTWKFDEFVELIRGKVRRPMTGPSRMQQRYSVRISSEIYQFLKKSTCEVFVAPFDVRLVRSGVHGN